MLMDVKAAGTIVEVDEAEDMPHCFQLFAAIHPACQVATSPQSGIKSLFAGP